MKRVWGIALAAAVVAASFGVAAPASAADASCWDYILYNDGIVIDGELQTVTVDINTLEIRVNPSALDGDVDMLVASIVDEVTPFVRFATCMEGGIVTATVSCLQAKVFEIVGSLDPANLNLRYVYQDPMTGELVIAGGVLVNDATACI